jgi:hypothetical protein
VRLIIHAGFPKCGSSAIQHALQDNALALKRESIFLFGKDLALNDRFRWNAPPFWVAAKAFLEPARRRGACDRIKRELERLSRRHPRATAIISAEVLAAPASALLLKGIDETVETTVVFYVRPQFQWIPSAWKQWALTRGAPLGRYVSVCLARDIPAFAKSLDAWSRSVPKARLIVRILPQAVAENGGPAADFFRTIGTALDPGDVPDSRTNPSLDYSVLHVLNKNPWIFAGKKEHRIFSALAEILPKQHLATNIKMLSLEQERRVAEHFRDENMHILRTFLHLDEAEATKTYAEYFEPRESGRSYADVPEREIARRGLGILMNAVLRQREAARSRRRPYRTLSSQAVKRPRDGD